jgi:hypothetical protein
VAEELPEPSNDDFQRAFERRRPHFMAIMRKTNFHGDDAWSLLSTTGEELLGTAATSKQRSRHQPAKFTRNGSEGKSDGFESIHLKHLRAWKRSTLALQALQSHWGRQGWLH